MTNKDLQKFKQWFAAYIAPFYGEDDYVNANLQMKEAHTHRVRRETRYITDALNLDENDARIAETVALLHDVGRFEQFTRYKTYADHRSENHSLLALKILQANNVLEDLDPSESRAIGSAIEFHGVKQIPESLDDRSSLLTKIIRDADKLDIYYTNIKRYKEYLADPDNFKLEIEYSDEPHCSPQIVNSILNAELVNYYDLKTLNDMRLMQLGWVYDINFSATFDRIKEKGYFEQLIALLPDDQTTEKIARHIMTYVENRLGQPQ